MSSRTYLFAAVLLIAACGDDGSPVDHIIKTDAGDDDDAATADQPKPCTLTIALLDYKLDPKNVSTDHGEITLCATNDGKAPHDLAVRDASKKTLGKTKTLGPNESDRFTVTLDAATYDIYCTQAGHESLGMKGTLTVD